MRGTYNKLISHHNKKNQKKEEEDIVEFVNSIDSNFQKEENREEPGK
jgi:hypothetical protein